MDIFVISDIHAKIENFEILEEKFGDLLSSIKINLKQNKKTVLVIVGDIAFSGKGEQYDFVKKNLAIDEDNFYITTCPGNHDHDFSSSKVRDLIIKECWDKIDNIESEYSPHLLISMDGYKNFSREITASAIFDEYLASSYEIDDFNFNSINSTLFSKIKEIQGTLKVPKSNLKPIAGKRNIAFLHHPINWLETFDSKELKRQLIESYDLVITGHEHDYDRIKLSRAGGKCLFIETPSFHDPSINSNGYIKIAVRKEDYQIDYYEWEENTFKSVESVTESFGKKLSQSNLTIEMKYDFERSLNEMDAEFMHPDKDDLMLSDLYVWPNLSDYEKSSIDFKRKPADKILSEEGRFIIYAEEAYGKTALLKMLYLDNLKRGNPCLFIDCKKYSNVSKIKINKLDKIVSQQYENSSLETFLKTNGRKILLVDNFDALIGRDSDKELLLGSYADLFDSIIITRNEGNTSYEIDTINISTLSTFKKYNMDRLGHSLRFEMIEKWNSLKSSGDSEINLNKLNSNAVKMIDGVIGRNYVPATPFFILSILQNIESGTASDMKTSAYGYYYEYLITSALGRAGIDKEQLDELYTYINSLSFYIYKMECYEFDRTLFETYNRDFNSIKRLNVNAEDRLKLLLEAKILRESGDDFRFKYPYVFYFFLSQYFAHNMEKINIMQDIEKVVDGMYLNKNTSILLFLTHHTKSSLILNKILDKSRSVFSGGRVVDIKKDFSFIAGLISELPSFEFKEADSDSRANRIALNKHKDEMQPLQAQEDVIDLANDDEVNENNENSEGSNLATMAKDMGVSFRCLEILGQIAKNYYGSLDFDRKEELLNEAIAAPLRSLHELFSLIGEDTELLIDLIQNNLKEKIEDTSLSHNEMRDEAKKALFTIVSTILLNTIVKVGTSISNKNLVEVISDIEQSNNNNNVYRLIDFAAKLDLGKLTVSDVGIVMKSIGNDPLSVLITRVLVINHLYMFDVSTPTAQSVCKKVGIKYEDIRSKKALLN